MLRLLGLAAIMFMAHGDFTAAQERFELRVPGTATRSTAELTSSSLSIIHQGNVSVYSRDRQYDAPGYLGFISTTLRQIVHWPNSGTGSMQIAEIPRLGPPQFRQSQMQITRVSGMTGTGSGLLGIGGLGGGASSGRPSSSRGPVDTSQSYRLTNAFLGPGRSLDSDARGTTAMARSGDFAGQSWRFVAAGTQTFRMVNDALGNGFSLTAHARDARPTMEPTDLRSTAQFWRLTPQGAGFQITNEALGIGWSLDNDGGGANDPIIAVSSNVTGQLWTLTKLATASTRRGIVGTWQEHDAATNRLIGITIEIRGDFTFKQIQPGNPDRVGTVQLVADRMTLAHNSGMREQFLVTQSVDRIDFRQLDGTPSGFFWSRSAIPVSPLVAPQRRISRRVVPNPALPPVSIEMANSHSEELWVLVSDFRDATQSMHLKIPAGKSVSVMLDRDSGSKVVEVWEVPTIGAPISRSPGSGTQTRTEERIVGETAPKPLYDISVYELFLQSIAIDRTRPDAAQVEDVNRAPKSVGLIKVPAGDRFKGGKTDIYASAKRQRNPGAAKRIDPTQWRVSTGRQDPLQSLLPPNP